MPFDQHALSPNLGFGFDGVTYISALELDGITTLRRAVARIRTRGAEERYFMGVALTAAERRVVREWMRSAPHELAAQLATARQQPGHGEKRR